MDQIPYFVTPARIRFSPSYSPAWYMRTEKEEEAQFEWAWAVYEATTTSTAPNTTFSNKQVDTAAHSRTALKTYSKAKVQTTLIHVPLLQKKKKRWLNCSKMLVAMKKLRRGFWPKSRLQKLRQITSKKIS